MISKRYSQTQILRKEMIHKLPLLLLLFILILFNSTAFAQLNSTISTDSLNLSYTGEKVIVSLEENAENGYYWHYSYLDSVYQETVDKISETLVFNEDDKMYRNFEFYFKKPGKVILFFELYRDWEGNSESIGQKSFPVLIQEPYQNSEEEYAYRGVSSAQFPYNKKIFTKVTDSPIVHKQAKTYMFTEGQSFMIDLESDIKGISWIPEISDKEVIRLVNDQIHPLENSTLHTFKFLALSTGQCDIRFRMLMNSGEVSDNPPLRYGVLVEPFKPVTAINHD